MSTYLLVHGSWHGAWCWDKVVPLLQREGHTVIAVDLPGHGGDHTPVPHITLQSYAERVCAAIDAQSEPVILVGHSMGGMVISQTAEYRPHKIQTLVYLAAFLLRDGVSLFQVGTADPESVLVPNLIPDEPNGLLRIKDGAAREAFYHDCPEADAARAISLLRPEPLAPVATPIRVTDEHFGRVPRVYIECLQDKALSPAVQKQMYTATPCAQVISLNTSHSPFYSAPEALAQHLDAVGTLQAARPA